jgi:hypothetical protein
LGSGLEDNGNALAALASGARRGISSIYWTFSSGQEGVMNFSMTEDEAEVAKEILAQNHRELLLEISRAEHHEFKLALQQREEVLKRLLEKLGVPEFTHS